MDLSRGTTISMLLQYTRREQAIAANSKGPFTPLCPDNAFIITTHIMSVGMLAGVSL